MIFCSNSPNLPDSIFRDFSINFFFQGFAKLENISRSEFRV